MNLKRFQQQIRQIGKIFPEKKFREEARIRFLQKIYNNAESWISKFSKDSKVPLPSASLKFSVFKALLGHNEEKQPKEKKRIFEWIRQKKSEREYSSQKIQRKLFEKATKDFSK